MFKLLLVALGAAVASAGYTFVNNVVAPNPYMNLTFEIDADAVITTTFLSSDSHETYGGGLDSWVNLLFSFEFFNFYMHQFTVAIVPVRFIPYTHEL
jgi:hypothetical protein